MLKCLLFSIVIQIIVCDDSKSGSQLAAEHFARVLREAKCDKPMPRVLYMAKLYPQYNKKYVPFATILSVCGSGSGCCSDETQRCVVKTIHKITLHFITLELTPKGNIKGVESINFDNHTQCECRHINSNEKVDYYYEDYALKTNLSFKSSVDYINTENKNQSNSSTISCLKETDWKSFKISSTTEQKSIPSDYIVWALYANTINETGFAQLEVHTNPMHADSAQAYHAGFIEGYLTAEIMAMHWRNQIDLYCDKHEIYCRKLFRFLDKNLNITQEKVKTQRNISSYWHQIGLVLEQLTGLQDGYNVKLWAHIPKKPRMDVDSKGLISLSIIPEFSELELTLNKTNSQSVRDGSCSAIVKPLADGSDLYVGHNTWVWYSMMLRVFKKFELNYRRLPNNDDSDHFIPGRISAFSSYPGALTSIDDFYILSSGLVVQETSITNINSNLWQHIKPEKIVLQFIRNLVSNRLSDSGKEWTQVFEDNNSGTYNDQFMVIDFNQFIAGTQPNASANDLLWVLEQMPGTVMSADVTDVLRSQGYWASYNVPYFEHIFNISGYNKLVELYGDYYSYNKTARALIFRRDQSKIESLLTFYSFMRYNDFEKDPLSECKCSPPYTAEYAISARNDLNDPNGTYPFDALGFRDWGAIDVKITNSEMSRRFEMLVVSSPSYERHQPFQWSNTKLSASIRHEGHPDRWAFAPYFIRWYPFDTEIAGVAIAENVSV